MFGVCGPKGITLLVADNGWNLAKVAWKHRSWSILGVFSGAGLYGRATRVSMDGDVTWTQVWLGDSSMAVAEALFESTNLLVAAGQRSLAGPFDVLPDIDVRGDVRVASEPFRDTADVPRPAWVLANAIHSRLLAENSKFPDDGCFASRVEAATRDSDGTAANTGGTVADDNTTTLCKIAVHAAAFNAVRAPYALSSFFVPSPVEDPIEAGWPDAGHWAYLFCDMVAALPSDTPGAGLILDACARPLPSHQVCNPLEPCGLCPCEYADCMESCQGGGFGCELLCDVAKSNCEAPCNGIPPECPDPDNPSCPQCPCELCPEHDHCKNGSCDGCPPYNACVADPEAPYCSWFTADLPQGG